MRLCLRYQSLILTLSSWSKKAMKMKLLERLLLRQSMFCGDVNSPESFGIRESAPPPFHLSTVSRFHVTKTWSPQATASLSLTPPFLPPLWFYLFLAQILQATLIPTSVKVRFKQSLPESPACILLESFNANLYKAGIHITYSWHLYNTYCSWGEDEGNWAAAEGYLVQEKAECHNLQLPGNCQLVWGIHTQPGY